LEEKQAISVEQTQAKWQKFSGFGDLETPAPNGSGNNTMLDDLASKCKK